MKNLKIIFTKDENLILITRDESGKPTLINEAETKLSAIRETLGIMPYLSRLVICMEGDNDIKFLKNINENIPELKQEFDLAANEISIIPINGGNLKNWVDRNYLKGSNVIEFHIYDSDSNSGKIRSNTKSSAMILITVQTIHVLY